MSSYSRIIGTTTSSSTTSSSTTTTSTTSIATSFFHQLWSYFTRNTCSPSKYLKELCKRTTTYNESLKWYHSPSIHYQIEQPTVSSILLSLPEEVLLLIIEYLDYETFKRLSSTCHYLHFLYLRNLPAFLMHLFLRPRMKGRGDKNNHNHNHNRYSTNNHEKEFSYEAQQLRELIWSWNPHPEYFPNELQLAALIIRKGITQPALSFYESLHYQYKAEQIFKTNIYTIRRSVSLWVFQLPCSLSQLLSMSQLQEELEDEEDEEDEEQEQQEEYNQKGRNVEEKEKRKRQRAKEKKKRELRKNHTTVQVLLLRELMTLAFRNFTTTIDFPLSDDCGGRQRVSFNSIKVIQNREELRRALFPGSYAISNGMTTPNSKKVTDLIYDCCALDNLPLISPMSSFSMNETTSSSTTSSSTSLSSSLSSSLASSSGLGTSSIIQSQSAPISSFHTNDSFSLSSSSTGSCQSSLSVQSTDTNKNQIINNNNNNNNNKGKNKNKNNKNNNNNNNNNKKQKKVERKKPSLLIFKSPMSNGQRLIIFTQGMRGCILQWHIKRPEGDYLV